MDASNAADVINDADLRRHLEEARERVAELLKSCASENRGQQISSMFALLLAEVRITAHVGGDRRRKLEVEVRELRAELAKLKEAVERQAATVQQVRSFAELPAIRQ